MGAWRALRHRLEAVLPEGAALALIARDESPTPATGYYQMHVDQEQALLERAFRAPAAAAVPPAPRPVHREAPAGARARGASQ